MRGAPRRGQSSSSSGLGGSSSVAHGGEAGVGQGRGQQHRAELLSPWTFLPPKGLDLVVGGRAWAATPVAGSPAPPAAEEEPGPLSPRQFCTPSPRQLWCGQTTDLTQTRPSVACRRHRWTVHQETAQERPLGSPPQNLSPGCLLSTPIFCLTRLHLVLCHRQHGHTQRHTHMGMRAHMSTHRHTHTYASTHTGTHTCEQSHRHTHGHTCTHGCTQMHTHGHTGKHAHRHTHMGAHTGTQMHTQALTHSPVLAPLLNWPVGIPVKLTVSVGHRMPVRGTCGYVAA